MHYQHNTIMKKYHSILLNIIVLTFFLFGNVSMSAQDDSDPRTVITKDLTAFSRVKIIDITKVHSMYTWGYPGIWIRETDGHNATITYNNVCSPYLSADVVDETLEVKLDQSFLYPSLTTWNPSYGMISAIIIEVPKKYNLVSVYNNGTYQYNTSLINFNSKNMTITSSNSFRLLNCKFKKLCWNQVENMPLADRCQYSLLLKLTKIGTLSIKETGLPEFIMGNNFGSKIKKIECVR